MMDTVEFDDGVQKYSIAMSTEEATRVRADPLYASEVYHRYLANGTKEQAGCSREFTEYAAETEVSPCGLAAADTIRWTTPATLLLLANWEADQHKFASIKFTKKEVWLTIASSMVEKGYPVTWEQCHTKWRNLQKKYKVVLDHNKKSGNNKKTWEFFARMDELLSSRPEHSPVAVAEAGVLTLRKDDPASAATGCAAEVEDNEDNEDDPQTATPKKPMTKFGKKRKSVFDLLEQWQHDKERRHQEKMALDQQFKKDLLEVLKRSLEKK